MKKFKKYLCSAAAVCALLFTAAPLAACKEKSDEVVLRVSNWEEYIDLGGWDDDEFIDIGDGVMGVNSMVDDFTEWFNGGNHGFKVKVEYSTFGTNEDLYNRLNLGDTYDLVCPSDYMIMKLIDEGKVKKYSDSFINGQSDDGYTQNVSPYIADIFEDNGWNEYAACYMWGTTGVVYNPELADEEDVKTWNILRNPDYARRVTIKDNVRDAYFAALGILNADELTSGEITPERRSHLLNDTEEDAVSAAQEILKEIKDNVYSFETDSGKGDMITGKVAANFQWSGDGVFIMDEAEADENHPTELWYSVPDECTNLWFDGWVMLKDGIGDDQRKQEAAEAFVNFLSRPDNAIRNMYYIGYSSAIAGDMVLDYINWNYGIEDDGETELYSYDLSYFFGKPTVIDADASSFILNADGTADRGRQLFAQYPPKSVIDRSVVMLDFGDKLGDINQMWINVRCLDVKDFNPAIVWTVVGVILAATAAILIYKFRYQIFTEKRIGKRKKTETAK